MDTPEETVGDRLRRARRSHGWSQKTLSQRLELRDSTITRYENNQRKLTLDVASKLATELGIDLYWLATGKLRASDESTLTLDRLTAAQSLSVKVEEKAQTLRILLSRELGRLKRLATTS